LLHEPRSRPAEQVLEGDDGTGRLARRQPEQHPRAERRHVELEAVGLAVCSVSVNASSGPATNERSRRPALREPERGPERQDERRRALRRLDTAERARVCSRYPW
jgi:hypothetical protein